MRLSQTLFPLKKQKLSPQSALSAQREGLSNLTSERVSERLSD